MKIIAGEGSKNSGSVQAMTSENHSLFQLLTEFILTHHAFPTSTFSQGIRS
jgi:hypothetical protein